MIDELILINKLKKRILSTVQQIGVTMDRDWETVLS
jgi:hypothetical protein